MAGRLAGDVALLRRGRRRAAHFWACQISVGSPAVLPVRAHELNARGASLARGAESWASNGPKLRSRRYLLLGAFSPMRVSRILRSRVFHERKAERVDGLDPARARAGAEIRDLAMVGRIEANRRQGERVFIICAKVSGVFKGQEYRRRRLRHRDPAFAPDVRQCAVSRRACKSSGLVGKNLGAGKRAVWGIMDEEVRWYKAPPSIAMTEHWNYKTMARISSAVMPI